MLMARHHEIPTPRMVPPVEAALDRLLKIAQVARIANVSERTVWRDINKGDLAVIRTATRVRVRLIDARRYAGL